MQPGHMDRCSDLLWLPVAAQRNQYRGRYEQHVCDHEHGSGNLVDMHGHGYQLLWLEVCYFQRSVDSARPASQYDTASDLRFHRSRFYPRVLDGCLDLLAVFLRIPV